MITESSDVAVEDNIIQTVLPRPGPSREDVVTGLHVAASARNDRCYNLKITGNIIHDSFDYCAIVPGMHGTTVPSSFTLGTFDPAGNKIILDNTVHSCVTGWVQMADITWNTHSAYKHNRLLAKRITAYRVSQLAMASMAETWNQVFEEVITFDNVRHVSINNHWDGLDASGMSNGLLDSCLIGTHIGTVLPGGDPCP